MKRAALVIALSACVKVAPEYRCEAPSDCVADGVPGRCEPTGYCSFPDVHCGVPGFRYDASAGEHAGICVLTQPFSEPPRFDLADAPDDRRGSCAPEGAREVSFEITTMMRQTLVFDTGGAGTTAAVAMSLHAGACPASGDELACTTHTCDASTYGWLAATVPAGTYCLLVEQADPASADTLVALRAVQAAREAQVLERPPFQSPPRTTCNAPPTMLEPTCALDASGPASTAVVMVCPGAFTFNASVDPDDIDGLDVALELRGLLPNGTEIGCVEAAAGPAPEVLTAQVVGAQPLWLTVDRVGGPQCGRFTMTVGLTPR